MGLDAIIKGWTGELKTRLINHLSLDERYRVFNNIIVYTDRGSTQIDHIIVSEFGIFTIETKDKSGWIFGGSDQGEWTQIIYNKKFKFQNPLRQNYRHTKSLSEFLGIEHDKIYSLIIFWGNCEFKSPMPDNVFKGSIFDNRIKKYIHSKTTTLFSTEEVNRISSQLTTLKRNAPSARQHNEELKNRYNSTTTCPKCGADLVKRISSRGEKAGKAFLGCSNYPRCHYIKDL